MDFIILFFAMLVGTVVGWYLREYYAMRKVHQMLQQAEQLDVREEVSDTRTKMRLEKHGELIYAFEEETDTFIAQGTDLLDLDEAIRKRFPEKKFSVQEQNLKDIAVEYHESV